MKAGLLGRTLGHSLSPQIHKLFGDYDYRLYEREPDDVVAFLREGFGSGDFDFLNVTIPYKRTVFALCDDVSPIARTLGNVNFVMRRSDGKIVGDNTDAFGVERLLDSISADVQGLNCAVLGSGGAALTAKAVLESRGAKRVTFVRRGEVPAQDNALIVNATPVGMYPDVDGARIAIADYPNCRYVIDLVYNPSPTRLVREARASGKLAVDGMVMLIAQAYRAYEQVAHPVVPHPSIFLYGPPASGKSTLAKKIAAATGKKHVDLDAEIVAEAGCSIADIFATEGEAAFRAREKRALERVVQGSNQVVALGGGALLDKESRELVERSGRVVVIDCPLEILAKRLSGDSRPLSTSAAKLKALIDARAQHYALFLNHIHF